MLSTRIAARAARASASKAQFVPSIATRTYAAPAAANSKPPVALFGVDGTYASALYTAAAKSDTLDPVAKILDSTSAVLKKDPKLGAILHAPSLSAEDKQSIVAELLKTAGGASGAGADTVKNFFSTLAENNRLGLLEGVCDGFAKLISAHKGEVELTITSATPLDQKVLRQLEQSVAKSAFVGQGKKLKVVPKVNPEIKGGLIVEVGDRTIDLSVSSKMAKMNKLLKETL
ncbi:ATP synthase subunit 5 [Myriangium duriaei CBS 260.36]|uniref:ATP synthase subunit 5, mitochondrial n=1 Tax=Myriangium duriaei CBS 260.36 TaxID=1168546 RepID=A0A9P4J4X4_9PEZI|nr:ATP synthase subunit 5 [Myriangium duriaei CBS 260.36]